MEKGLGLFEALEIAKDEGLSEITHLDLRFAVDVQALKKIFAEVKAENEPQSDIIQVDL